MVTSTGAFQQKRTSWQKRIVFHGSYWILNVLFFTVYFSSRNDYQDFIPILISNLVYLPGGMMFAYYSIYYLLPKFFFRKRILQYLVLQTVVLMLYPVWSGFLTLYITDPYIWLSSTHFTLASHLLTIIILVFGMVPIASVKIAQRFIQDNAIKEALEKARIEAELKFKETELKLLKAQIQPHFLFNTLNNLYSLALSKSEKTPGMILTISDLLSYIIYDCTAEKVSFEKEINFIRNYIALEKLRYDENLSLSLTIPDNFSGKYIAPMILHTFVENSFKHGAGNDPGNPWISLDLSFIDGVMNFKLSNSKVPAVGSGQPGIGIRNARKRLEHIYPGRHTLNIVNEEQVYSLTLEIIL
jgi:two-component system, LytTR family, sensor kinase